MSSEQRAAGSLMNEQCVVQLCSLQSVSQSVVWRWSCCGDKLNAVRRWFCWPQPWLSLRVS